MFNFCRRSSNIVTDNYPVENSDFKVSTRRICSHKNPTHNSSSSKQTSSLTNRIAVFSCSLQQHDGEEETRKDENNEKKETMDNEMAERLDIVMTMMLEYIKMICYTEGIRLPGFSSQK